MFILVVFLIIIIIFVLRSGKGKQNSPSASTSDRITFLSHVIYELKKVVSENPQKKVQDLVESYQEEIKSLSGERSETHPPLSPAAPPPPPKTLLQEDISQIWSNWYSDNAINLLLYVGSFLIVASATIFVSFQWEQLGGSVKAMVFTAITLAFLVSGFLFYRVPKIRNAGATFIAIAALLIPFNGLAWYNFVLKDQGASFGSVWLTTSVLAMVVYATLAYLIRHPFYTYIAGFGGLSLVLAFVNVANLQKEYYILGAIFSSFVMLVSTRIIAHPDSEQVKMYERPLNVSAHILMPISLVWGLLLAMQSDKIFSLEVSLAMFIAVLYYLVAYSFARQINFFLISIILFPINLYLFTNFLHFSSLWVAYSLQLLFCGYLLVTPYIHKRLPEHSAALTVTAITGSIIVFVMSLSEDFSPISLTFMALFPTLFGLLAAYFQNKAQYLYVNFIFLAITIFIYFIRVLDLDNGFYLLGLSYTFIGVFFYLIVLSVREHTDYQRPFAFATTLYVTLGFTFTAVKPGYFLTTNLITAALLADTAFRFKKPEVLFISNLMLSMSLWSILRIFNTNLVYYPFYFAGLPYLYYIGAQLLPATYQNIYRTSALINSLGTVMLFGALVQTDSGYYYEDNFRNVNPDRLIPDLETSALFSAYSAFFLYSLDAVLRRSAKVGYMASVLGMVCYLWQIKYLEVSHLQAYTLPLGLYFMTLAYLQRLFSKGNRRDVLDFLGLAFLLVPTFFQSLRADGFMYALLLGFEGLVIFGIGTSIKYKGYIYTGIAALVLAIFSQTYVYLNSMPRWLITALAGLIILGVATYLMLHRQEPHQEEK